MQVKNLQAQKGFTLVEIAIVLVIIGLLLGGVLKGQELIQNAKLKSVAQDLEGVSAAYWAYQDRKGSVATSLNDLATEKFIDSSAPENAFGGTITYVAASTEVCANGLPTDASQPDNIVRKLGNAASVSGTTSVCLKIK